MMIISVNVLALAIFLMINEGQSRNYTHHCHTTYELSCNLAIKAIEPFRTSRINRDMINDHHGSLFIIIDHRTRQQYILRPPNAAGGWFNGHDGQILKEISGRSALPSMILPMNPEDSSISKSSDLIRKYVISFCQKGQNIDILWPSSQFHGYPVEDYTINKTEWLIKQNKAWFRGNFKCGIS